MTYGKFGQALPRVEDRKLVTGRGCYVDDIVLSGMVHGVLIHSNQAHARIKSIDVSRALQAPGVLAILTGNDIQAHRLGGLPPLFMPEDTGGPKGYRTSRPLLTRHTVRHVGDRVAFCIAETLAQARDAAELVAVQYESLPNVTGLADATTAGAPAVWEGAPDNVCFTLRMGDAAAAEKRFASAAHRVRLKLTNNRVTATSMEPRGAIGIHNAAEDSFVLYTSTQNPHRVREMLAHSVFAIPESHLRVVGPDVGGGFGMKGDTYPELSSTVGSEAWNSRDLKSRPH